MTDKKTQGHKDSGTQRHKKTKTQGQKDTGTQRHRRDTKTQEEIIRQEILKTSKAFLYLGASDILDVVFKAISSFISYFDFMINLLDIHQF